MRRVIMSLTSSDVSDSQFDEMEEFSFSPFMFEPERSESQQLLFQRRQGMMKMLNRVLLFQKSVWDVLSGASENRWAMDMENNSLYCRDNNNILNSHFQGFRYLGFSFQYHCTRILIFTSFYPSCNLIINLQAFPVFRQGLLQ